MTDLLRESIAIRRSGRRLGGELAYAPDADPAFAALVIGPHPYMGGTMQNALIAAIALALARAGGVSLRFDYAGTGRSRERATVDVAASMAAFWKSGHAPEDPERLADAEAALRSLEALGVQPLLLVGYSFGAAAAWRLVQAEAVNVAGAALVSPTLSRHDFARVPGGPLRPTLVIHSRDDFCTPEPVVAAWVRSQSTPIQYSCHPAGNHFFRGVEHRIGLEVAHFATAVCRPRSGCTAC